MATTQRLTIPARRGAAARVTAGQRVKVTNTHGTQVVDTWAFNANDVTEWMSMEASRAWFMKLRAAVGDTFLTNQRRPILTLIEDTSGGAHDTLMTEMGERALGALLMEVSLTLELRPYRRRVLVVASKPS